MKSRQGQLRRPAWHWAVGLGLAMVGVAVGWATYSAPPQLAEATAPVPSPGAPSGPQGAGRDDKAMEGAMADHRRGAASGPADDLSLSAGARTRPGGLEARPASQNDCQGMQGAGDGSADSRQLVRIGETQDAITRGLLARGDTAGRQAAWLHEAARGLGQGPLASATTAAANLATEARDAQAQTYAWALRACAMASAGGAPPSACTALSNQRWTELAPDSVWPWLALGGEARLAGDLSGFENAMHRASLATDWHNPMRDFQALAHSQLPAGASDLDKAGALIGPINSLVDQSMAVGQVALYCPTKQDANRQQSCQRLVRQLLAHADNLLELRIGLSVGARSGLTEAELAPSRADDAAAMRAVTLPDAADVGENQVCAALNRTMRRAVRMMEVGELQALREEAAKLPR